MNELDYCTLPIAKRLQEAGVVVETEVFWTMTHPWGGWELTQDEYIQDCYPARCREIAEFIIQRKDFR